MDALCSAQVVWLRTDNAEDKRICPCREDETKADEVKQRTNARMKEWRGKKGAGSTAESVCLESSFKRLSSRLFALSQSNFRNAPSISWPAQRWDGPQSINQWSLRIENRKRMAERRKGEQQRYPASATRMRAPDVGCNASRAQRRARPGSAARISMARPGDWLARRHSREMRCALFEQGPVLPCLECRCLGGFWRSRRHCSLLRICDNRRQAMRPGGELFRLFPFNP